MPLSPAYLSDRSPGFGARSARSWLHIVVLPRLGHAWATLDNSGLDATAAFWGFFRNGTVPRVGRPS